MPFIAVPLVMREGFENYAVNIAYVLWDAKLHVGSFMASPRHLYIDRLLLVYGKY